MNVDIGLCNVEIKNMDTFSESIIEAIVASEVIFFPYDQVWWTSHS